jgi:hypothetical protein
LSTFGRGVYGIAVASTGTNYGLYGETQSPSGFGIYGKNVDGLAGGFEGDIHVMGNTVVDDTLQTAVFAMETGASDGYVLMSNGSGIGTWQSQATLNDSDWAISDDNMYSSVSGNVGIGTAVPAKKLDVLGDAQISGTLYTSAIAGASPLQLMTTGMTRIYVADGFGNVGIGTTAPHETALLDINSDSKGLLLPRLTTSQRDAILDPAVGLVIFNVDSLCIDYYTGTDWYEICGSLSPSSEPDSCYGGGSETCPTAQILGEICGDAGSDHIQRQGCGGGWWKFLLEECDNAYEDLTCTITLQPPSGMNYDLYLYSPCGTLEGSSTNSGEMMETLSETVEDEYFGSDDSQWFFIEIVLVSGNSNYNWTLDIYGNT